MERAQALLTAAALLLGAAALAAPSAAAEETSDSQAAADGEAKSSRAAAAQAQTQTQTQAQSRPATARPAAARAQPAPGRKVWTAADLERLRNRPGSAVLVLESKDPVLPRTGLRRDPGVSPQEVVDRYAQIQREAERKLAELEREKLAASNPFLRGLASETGGPRGREQIEQDIQSWRARRDAAKDNLDRARALTGAKPETPPAESR